MTQQVFSLEARLTLLERRCRKLSLGVVVLAAILATACLSSAIQRELEVLEARKIVLKRADGSTGIVLDPGAGNPAGTSSSSAILLIPPEGGVASAWTVGRARDDEEAPWENFGYFFIEASGSLDEPVAYVSLLANETTGWVKTHRGTAEAVLEAEGQRTSLRFLDIDLDAEEEEEKDKDRLRVSLELVDGEPALRAFDTDGETTFEQP